jgi:hypothetical protein
VGPLGKRSVWRHQADPIRTPSENVAHHLPEGVPINALEAAQVDEMVGAVPMHGLQRNIAAKIPSVQP